MTLGERVQHYAGAIANQEMLSGFLTSALRTLVDLVPEGKLHRHTKTAAISNSSGLGIGEYKIVSVERGGVTARWIPIGALTQSQDTASMLYAGDTDPVYYFKNERVYGSPATGTWTASVFPYQDVSAGDERVPNFPVEYEGLIILGAAQSALIYKIDEERGNMPAMLEAPTFTFPSYVQQVSPVPLDVTTKFDIDLEEEFLALNAYVSVAEDFELAQAKIGQIQASLVKWSKEAELELQKLMYNAKNQYETNVWNLLNIQKADMEQFNLRLQHYLSAVQSAIQKMNYLTGQLQVVAGMYQSQLAMAFGAKQ